MKITECIRSHRKTVVDALIILAIALIAITWFRGDFYIKFGDGFFTLNPADDLYRSLYGWEHVFSSGLSYPRAALLPYFIYTDVTTQLGLSLVNSEELLYYGLFALSGLSMYYLTRVTLGRSEGYRLAAIVSALFYMMNTFSMSIVWGRQILIIFTYSLIPLFLALFILGLDSKKPAKYSILIALLAMVMAPAIANVYVAVIIVIMLVLYLLIHISTNRERGSIKKIIKFISSTVVLVILLSLWWILIYLPALGGQYSAAMTYSPPLDTFIAASAHSTMFNDFQMLGWHLLGTAYGPDPVYVWASNFNTPLFVMIGLIVPIVAFATLILARSNKFVIYFGMIALVTLFIIKGDNNPLGELNTWVLTNVPGASAFRIPFDKFGYLLALAYAFLFGVGVSKLYKKSYEFIESSKGFFKNRIRNPFRSRAKIISTILVIVILLLVQGLYAYPFWNGDVINSGGSVLPSERIQIPDYYYQAQSWIESNPGEYKILKLPPAIQGASTYDWDYGYHGSDPLDEYFFPGHPILGMKWGQTYADGLEDNLENYVTSPPLNNSNMGDALGLLNIKYALVHNDWKSGFDAIPSPSYYSSVLNGSNDMVQAGQFGELQFYGVNNLTPFIYASGNLVNTSSDFQMTTIQELMATSQFSYQQHPAFLFNNSLVKDQLPDSISANVNVLPLAINKVSTFDVSKNGSYSLWISPDVVSNNSYIVVDIDGIDYIAQFAENKTDQMMEMANVDLGAGEHFMSITESPTTTLFAVDSSTYHNSSDWKQIGTNWTSNNGWISGNYSDDGYLILNRSVATANNFTISTTIKIEQPNSVEDSYSGLVFNVQDKNNMTGAFIKRTPSTGDSFVEIWNLSNGVWSKVSSQQINPIVLGQSYNLTVECQDSHFKVSVDGVQVLPKIGWLNLASNMASNGSFGIRSRFSNTSFSEMTISENGPNLAGAYLVENTEPKTTALPVVSFQKINPTQYQVEIQNASSPYLLVFSESFDGEWKLKIDGNALNEASHLVVNGFANGWLIDKNGSYVITIEYQNQVLYTYGLWISGISLVLSVAVLMYIWRAGFHSLLNRFGRRT